MTYASHARRPNPAALAGALGIPAAVGALLVVGLAVTVTIAPEAPRLKGFTVKPLPVPPPPPDPVEPAAPTSTPTAPTAPITTLPPRPDILPVDLGLNNPINVPINTGVPIGTGAGTGTGPIDFGIPQPTPSASAFTPVGAKPRGNPGGWLRDSDYRPRWLREGLSGSASFTLAIDASGAVTGCTITRSTGYGELDAATCDLVTKRARFDAARDGSGKPVAGSYTGAIRWRIPD
jgi:protein TonB